MADREEQLLNDLLGEVAHQDARLDAAHLEARVLEACAETVRLKPDTPSTAGPSDEVFGLSRINTPVVSGFSRARSVAVFFLAAAASLALVVSTTVTRPDPQPGQPFVATTPPQVHTEVPIDAALPKPTTRAPKVVPAPAAPAHVNAEAAELPAQVPEPAASDAPAEFVPLMPLTAQDLTGPFQLVRVQMPRASLGPLRSPLDHPAELVEADVLLGEDGRARAIRISAAGSIYPWRSR